MSIMLSFYTRDAFEEVLLPAINDSNFTIRLNQERYSLTEPAEVKLEVLADCWYVQDQEGYQVFAQNMPYQGAPLKHGDILHLQLAEGRTVTMAVTAASKELEPLTKYTLDGLTMLSIGKAADNVICVDGLELVSGHHACLRRSSGGWMLEDTSRNGTYVGTERINGARLLAFGDCINIFGTKIIYLGEMIAVSDNRPGVHVQTEVLRPCVPRTEKPPAAAKEKTAYFRRSPRNIPRVCEETLEIEGPPPLQAVEQRPLLLTIGPSFTMTIPMMLGCLLAIYGRGGAGGVYMYTGIVTAVSSAMLGVMWALINLRYAKKRAEEQKQLRFSAYSDYLIQITDYLKEKQSLNAGILLDAYPSAEDCTAFTDQEPRLWNRNFSHEDFLLIRLGLGDIPFQMQIQAPPKRFSLMTDSMAERPQMLREQYEMLRDVPVGVNLMDHSMVGVVSSQRGCFDLARSIAVQIAANHCYTEVKMAFVGKNAAHLGEDGWEFARWLPHVWSEGRKFRYFARNAQESHEVLYELSKVFRARAEEKDDEEIPKPHYVLFLDDASVLENEPIAKYILEPQPSYGLTTILLSETYEGLPNACRHIVQNDEDFSGMYSVEDILDERKTVRFDTVSAEEADRFARAISGIRVNELESGGDIPNVLDYFDMVGISSLEEMDVANRWKKNRTYESMRALIGKKAGNADCYLDIHEKYHGPHGLVAGTTGSGKSETLQTYILSLAMNFSPQDVAFLLIDFKGGGMANLFRDLPHTAGCISNLSGSQIRRAMVSIKSENQRRQRIFGEYGVNHIDGYTKLYKNQEAPEPIPHLLIVIDEFAEMKREEPDFMRELISVAQVGRSLGVHLILATQKPGGTVDDSIRSNTKFRLCLRVQDRQDSAEMLHRPDAAYITQAGRCYLQVGNDEIYELFQSGWSGARYDESRRKNRTAAARMIDSNGRAAMAGNHSELLQKEKKKLEWVHLLMEHIRTCAQQKGFDLLGSHSSAEVNAFAETAADELIAANINFTDSRKNRIQLAKLIACCAGAPEEETEAYLIRQMDSRSEKLPEWKEKTQLDAVVEYLAYMAKKEHCESGIRLWLPPLPEHLPLEQLVGEVQSGSQWPGEEGEWSLETTVGLYDAPENQVQLPLTVDFANNGHHAICGIVNCGKSTFLQTMLYGLVNRYSPAHLNIYALDFGGGKLGVFRSLPHVGGILDGSDPAHVQKFFHMMEKMLEERQKLFAGANYTQYVKAHGKTLPAVLVVIDQYANFREKTDNAYDAAILRISSVGVSCGIYLAVTSGGFGSAEIPNRLAESFRTAISLEMGDKFKYGDILRTMHFSTLPEANVKGRGLVSVGGSILEFQTALPVEAADDYQMTEKIEAVCRSIDDRWGGRKRARGIPVIPEKPVWEDFRQLEDFQIQVEDDRHLPLGYLEEDAGVYSVDLSQTFCYLISGKARSGRTSALRLLMSSAAEKGGRLVVIDTASGELKRMAEQTGARYVQSRKELFDFMKDLYQLYPARNRKKRALVEQDLSEEEIYTGMDEEKIFVFVHDMVSFMGALYAPPDEAAGIGGMNGFAENVFEKGKLHQIYWFAVMDADKNSQCNGYRAYNAFCGYRTGIHLGGEIDRQRIFSFDNIPFAQRGRSTKPGMALAAVPGVPNQADVVVLPLRKG